MDRYEFNNIIKTENTPRYRSSTRYPNIPLSIDDAYIITQYGDRLDNLAYQFYQDSSYWWIISAANPDLPKDSLYPPLGYQLRIPVFDADIIRSLDILNA
jgi:hypothetical protein